MIRVIYRWQVESENFEAFKQIWTHTTNHIHESILGALGSFMLRLSEDGTEVLTVAKWDSLESWEKFGGNKNPKEMEEMRALGKRISVEVFEEIYDYTEKV